MLGRPDVWRGSQPLVRLETVPSGDADLDAALPGGGWPLGTLVEVCCAQPGLGELSLFLPALVRLADADRWLAFVAPPHPLYAPALAQAGVPLERCLVVALVEKGSEYISPPVRRGASRRAGKCTLTPFQALWAAEQLLRGGACAAVVLWSADDDANALRRLQLAAESGHALAVLYRPLVAAERVSPAALRLRIARGDRAECFKCRGTTWHPGRGHTFRLRHAVARRPPAVVAAGPGR